MMVNFCWKNLQIFGLLVFGSIFISATAVRADISGLWKCEFGLGNSSTGYPQDLNLFDSNGVVSGQEFSSGTHSPFADVTGTSSGSSFSLKAQYTGSSYYALIDGTVSGGSAMSGNWHNDYQSGLFQCTLSGASFGPTPPPSASPTPSSGKRASACTLFCNRTGLGGFTPDGLNTADCYATVADGKSKESGLIPTGTVTFTATDGFLPATGQCQLVQTTQVASCNFQLSIPSVPPFPIGVRFPIGFQFAGDSTFDPCTAGHHLLVASCLGSTTPDGDPACTKSVGLNTKDKPKFNASGVLKALVECGGNLATPTPADKQELCIVDGKYSTTLALTLVGLTGDQFNKIAAAITAGDIKKFPALKFIKDAGKKYNTGELTLILSNLADINKLLKGKRTSIEVGGRSFRALRPRDRRKASITTSFSMGTLAARVKAGTITEKSVKAPKETRQFLSILSRIGITNVPVTVTFTAKRTDVPKKKVKNTVTFDMGL